MSMSADFSPLNRLINSLTPSQRKKLAHKIGLDIRRVAGQRIKKNIDPDGNAFTPRKPQRRKATKKKMFQKLSQLRKMKVSSHPNGASITYKSNRDKYIAKVHHDGETVVLNRKSKIKHKYAARKLFGLNFSDERMIEHNITKHLGF